jgi:hypothetical protein
MSCLSILHWLPLAIVKSWVWKLQCVTWGNTIRTVQDFMAFFVGYESDCFPFQIVDFIFADIYICFFPGKGKYGRG